MMKEYQAIMLDQDVRKSFGKRLKQLRKQKRWTQKELAAMIMKNKIQGAMSPLDSHPK